MQRAVSMSLDQNPHNIAGYVLGEHGESQFAAWSTITVQGEPITEIAKDQYLELSELDKAARGGGWLVFNGKKYTCYAIATCAAKLLQAVFSDAKLACPASVYLEDYGCYVGYPAVIGKNGVEYVHRLELTEEEKKLLDKSDVSKIPSEALSTARGNLALLDNLTRFITNNIYENNKKDVKIARGY